MKKIFYIVLILTLLLEVGGCIFIFKIKQYSIRKEIKTKIKEGVPQQELVIFRFSEEQLAKLEWKHSREFRFRDMMYDIVRRSVENDIHILYCVSDEQENRLFVRLDEMTHRSLSKDLPFRQPFSRLMNIFNVIIPGTTALLISNSFLENDLNYFLSPTLCNGFDSVNLPPPEMI